MINIGSAIDAALHSNDPIPQEQVRHWIDNAKDLPTLSKLYRLTDEGYYRIQPDLGMDATCGLIQHYLVECIRENVTENEQILSRFEAPETLRQWFCHLVEMEGTSGILTRAARAVTDLFLTGGEEIRNSIETAFLEHALETAALRPYFEHWASDDSLRPAWKRALEWGKSHPDYMSRLIRQIPKS